MTETNNNLLAALKDLHALQAEIEDPKLDSENPHFRSQYTSLREVLRIARPLLNKHNFVLVQSPSNTEHGMLLVTELIHVPTGINIDSRYALKPVKDDPQGMGAAITYARRYALKAMLAMDDADDDGNEASGLPAEPKNKRLGAPKVDPRVTRQEALVKWILDNVELVNAFLRAPTYGPADNKQPWISESATWEALTPGQLDVILKSDKTVGLWKNAVLTFNGITP